MKLNYEKKLKKPCCRRPCALTDRSEMRNIVMKEHLFEMEGFSFFVFACILQKTNVLNGDSRNGFAKTGKRGGKQTIKNCFYFTPYVPMKPCTYNI